MRVSAKVDYALRAMAELAASPPGPVTSERLASAQLPLLSRTLRVVVDWTVSLFFRRDTAELSGLGHPRKLAK